MLSAAALLGGAASLCAADELRIEREAQGIALIGLTEAQLEKIEAAELSSAEWAAAFTLSVVSDESDPPPMAGSYSIEDRALRFTAAFPFSKGMHYRGAFEPSDLPERATVPHRRSAELVFDIAKPETKPSTHVAAIHPTAATLPENQLRFYLEFSAPMRQGEVYEHVSLIDDAGKKVDRPFLELEQELWDASGKRFTLYLDPGRVKRGLKPREEVGPALYQNRTYRLVVSDAWRDAQGNPLVDSFTKKFRVTAPDFVQPATDTWKVTVPAHISRAPLEIVFPESLDHGMLKHMIEVFEPGGARVPGTASSTKADTIWRFVPDAPWIGGEHTLSINTLLEDLAGNSIQRPFEILPGIPAGDPKKADPTQRARITFSIDGARAASTNWPSWRGPHGDGTAETTGLPTKWSATENVRWKTKLDGSATSTPVIWGDRIFLTAQLGSDAKAKGRSVVLSKADPDLAFAVFCLDRKTGDIVWSERIQPEGKMAPTHSLHNQSTPSCVTDGERVYAWFATGQLACFDFDGKRVWDRHLGKDYHAFDPLWGHASSPVLHGDKLVLLCDHNAGACLVALDKTNGSELWKIDRGKALRSYSTPIVVRHDGTDQIVINSNPGIAAYALEDGRALWSYDEFCKVPVPVPTFKDGVLFASRGYTSGPYMALSLSGKNPTVKWRTPSQAPYVSSILHYRDRLYLSSESGRVTVCAPETGEILWVKKLGARFWSSPVAADGKVYLLDESGETIVMDATAAEPAVLARIALGERSVGSPAIASGNLFIRTTSHLYCIGAAE